MIFGNSHSEYDGSDGPNFIIFTEIIKM